MPLYAIAIDGPLEKPNRSRYVEIVGQDSLPDTFHCIDILDGARLSVRRDHLELVWLNAPKPS